MTFAALFGNGNSTTASAAAGTSLASGKPANVIDGDLLVAAFYCQTSTGTVTPPTGWTLADNLGASGRRGGFFYKAIPSASAETATSYSFGISTSTRLALDIFRVTGANLTNPVDVAGTNATEVATATVTLPGITTTTAGDLLLALAYWNNSPATISTFVSTMTVGEQVATPLQTGTSGIAVATQNLDAVGVIAGQVFTSSPTATNSGGILVALRPAFATQPLTGWLAATPLYVAHRNEELDWPEETLYGYGQAAAWNSEQALEISVQRTSDGVWVACHDADTARVFNGPDLVITASTWSQLQSKTTLVGNQPIALMTDIMQAHQDRILMVDNKNVGNLPEFFNLMDSNGGPGRIIIKGVGASSGTATYVAYGKTRGYRAWGYFYDTDNPTNLDTYQGNFDILGMDYTASQSAWTKVLSYGKQVLGHITPNLAARTTAMNFGAVGVMASKATDGTVPGTSNLRDLTLTATPLASRFTTTPLAARFTSTPEA